MSNGAYIGIGLFFGGLLGFFFSWIRHRGNSQAVDLNPLVNRLDVLEKGNERTERAVKDEIARQREEAAAQARALREELGAVLKSVGDSTVNSLGEIGKAQRGQLETFSGQLAKLIESNEKKLGELRTVVETKLTQIQTDNAAKLEEMRKTVDEKLQGTLEKRLGESFRQVSERLEQVHKGLGEMQNLATGVGDLKKVLTNVKTRGTWGEMQLGNLLEQILTRNNTPRTSPPSKGARSASSLRLNCRGGTHTMERPSGSRLTPSFPRRTMNGWSRLRNARTRMRLNKRPDNLNCASKPKPVTSATNILIPRTRPTLVFFFYRRRVYMPKFFAGAV